jgi:hypothetical protein
MGGGVEFLDSSPKLLVELQLLVLLMECDEKDEDNDESLRSNLLRDLDRFALLPLTLPQLLLQ